jgi:hypothetical protein
MKIIKPSEAQVWSKFRRVVEAKGFLMLSPTKKFKKEIYDSFMKEYNLDPITVEEFANIIIVGWQTAPHRSIDNIKAEHMKASS